MYKVLLWTSKLECGGQYERSSLMRPLGSGRSAEGWRCGFENDVRAPGGYPSTHSSYAGPATNTRRQPFAASKATTTELTELFQYLEHQWIDSSVWSVREWSVYRQPVRSNNVVKGWHRRINAKAGRACLQYILVPLFLREACLLSMPSWSASTLW